MKLSLGDVRAYYLSMTKNEIGFVSAQSIAVLVNYFSRIVHSIKAKEAKGRHSRLLHLAKAIQESRRSSIASRRSSHGSGGLADACGYRIAECSGNSRSSCIIKAVTDGFRVSLSMEKELMFRMLKLFRLKLLNEMYDKYTIKRSCEEKSGVGLGYQGEQGGKVMRSRRRPRESGYRDFVADEQHMYLQDPFICILSASNFFLCREQQTPANLIQRVSSAVCCAWRTREEVWERRSGVKSANSSQYNLVGHPDATFSSRAAFALHDVCSSSSARSYPDNISSSTDLPRIMVHLWMGSWGMNKNGRIQWWIHHDTRFATLDDKGIVDKAPMNNNPSLVEAVMISELQQFAIIACKMVNSLPFTITNPPKPCNKMRTHVSPWPFRWRTLAPSFTRVTCLQVTQQYPTNLQVARKVTAPQVAQVTSVRPPSRGDKPVHPTGLQQWVRLAQPPPSVRQNTDPKKTVNQQVAVPLQFPVAGQRECFYKLSPRTIAYSANHPRKLPEFSTKRKRGPEALVHIGKPLKYTAMGFQPRVARQATAPQVAQATSVRMPSRGDKHVHPTGLQQRVRPARPAPSVRQVTQSATNPPSVCQQWADSASVRLGFLYYR
ncbi:hypothetical protein KSP40_PGU000173 [Platanthera guangdongensis]|uniref:Uncharacterized protein n=1 Tax=Platanthera guangdongensis TaxID=2320717 RepID=A0ABR2LGQ3_9ASPA